MTVEDMIKILDIDYQNDVLNYREGQQIIAALRAAATFVEGREEATENIWYCRGETGRELLKALGIPYGDRQ